MLVVAGELPMASASGSDNGSAGGLRPWPGPGAVGLDADAGSGGGDAAACVAAALQSRRRAAGETYSRKEKSLGLLCEKYVADASLAHVRVMSGGARWMGLCLRRTCVFQFALSPQRCCCDGCPHNVLIFGVNAVVW